MSAFDIVVVGGGPAGLTAAIYARRANKTVLVIEKDTLGGQITSSPKVENIPGFPALSGNEFAEKLLDQALAQGAEIDSACVTGVRPEKDGFAVLTDAGERKGRSVILATGSKHRALGLPGEEERIGAGVSFCAVCDGAFYQGAPVAVVGGGNSALQEALLLSDLASSVTVVQDLDFLTGEEALQKQLAARPNVSVVTGARVVGYLGDGALTGLLVRKTATGEETVVPCEGAFLAIGLLPQNEPFADLIALDERGYAASGEDCKTAVPGLFVAGDCRRKSVRQVVTAAADGAAAALAACAFLKK